MIRRVAHRLEGYFGRLFRLLAHGCFDLLLLDTISSHPLQTVCKNLFSWGRHWLIGLLVIISSFFCIYSNLQFWGSGEDFCQKFFFVVFKYSSFLLYNKMAKKVIAFILIFCFKVKIPDFSKKKFSFSVTWL